MRKSARVGEWEDPPGRGGGGTVGEVDEKIVRLGLGGMGVPSSSSTVGGGGTG